MSFFIRSRLSMRQLRSVYFCESLMDWHRVFLKFIFEGARLNYARIAYELREKLSF